MLRQYRTPIIISSVFLVMFLYILGGFSYLRYQYEIRFGKPETFFYGVNFAIMVDDLGEYDEEYRLDDEQRIVADLPTGNKEYFLYGRFVNSADPLVVILNDKVIYNGHPSSDSNDVVADDYIKKHFVVELKEFSTDTENKVIISTGNAREVYSINAR